MAQELSDDEVFGQAPAEPVAPAETPPAELSDADVFGEDDRTRLRLSVGEALQRDPERSARVVQLRAQTGLPDDVIERNFEEVDRQARVDEFDQLRETSPALAGKLADPAFANLAHDDTETLGAFEEVLRVTKNIGRALGAAPYRAGAGLYGIGRAAAESAETAGRKADEATGGLFELPALLRKGGKAAADWLTEQQRQGEAWANYVRGPQEGAGFVERSALGGIESAGQQLLMLPLAVMTGSPAPLLYTTAATTAGEAYGKARDQGVEVPEALVFAGSQGVIEYATERLPAIRLLEDLTGGTGFGKTVLAQLATEIPGEQLATILQDLNEWAVLNPEKPFADYLAERPSAAAQTLIATIVGTSTQTLAAQGIQQVGERITARAEQAQTAERTAEFFKQVTDLAANSKLRERSPESFQQFVEEAAKDGPVQDVYIDAGVLAETLSQSGIDPTLLPVSVTEQMDEALASKGDVRIPIGEYAATLAATDAAPTLLPHLRASPEDLSQAEAKEFMQGQAEQFKAEAKKVLEEQDFDQAWQESAKTVETELLTQLNRANRFTPDVNTAYASMMGSFYSVQAARLGITPEEMYVRYPLRIQAESPAGGATMAQGEAGPDVLAPADTIYKDSDLVGPIPAETAAARLRAQIIELEKELRTSTITGLRNLRAFEEDESLRWPVVAAADMDGLKRLNRAVGHEQADRVIATLGNVMLAAEQGLSDRVRSYHRSGDEFAFRFKDQETAEAFMAELEERLEKVDVTLEVDTGSGREEHVYTGIGISHGLGENYDAADKQAEIRKTDRLLSGRREDPHADPARPPRRLRRAADRENPLGQVDESQLRLFQPVYHGSPHDFDRFSTEHIGRGEGNQAYGWGLYFAEDPKVAGYYRDSLGEEVITLDGQEISNEELSQLPDYERAALTGVTAQGEEKALARAREMRDEGADPEWMDNYEEAVRALAKKNPGRKIKASLYQVDIPDEAVARMLDWDKPLSEQSEVVLKAIRKIEFEDVREQLQTFEMKSSTGRSIYMAIERNFANDKALHERHNVAEKGAARAASEYLRSLGISGLKYLDAGSRDTVKGTHNLVVFDDSVITLTHKDGKPVSAKERAEYLQQIAPGTNRGSITFGPDGTTISLLQHADLSTFLHESGHFYLEVLTDIATQPDAPAEIATDLQTLLDWFGVKDAATWQAMTIDQRRDHHEKFARGFEAYLFEGKAPSTALGNLFARFRAWMLNVYRSIQGLNVELTDEVRGVMDRLLATQQQIEEAETARGYVPLFDTRPDGMTDAEWTRYQESAAEPTAEAVEQLQRRSLRDMQWLQNARGQKLKALQKDADQKRAAVHREVVNEVRAKPVYTAQNFMRKGDLPGATETGKGVKLSLPAIREMLETGTPEQRAALAQFTNEHADLLVEAGGIHPDELAGMFGFTSGDHLIQAINEAGPEADTVAGLTDQRMLERYGDIIDPQALAKAANEAVHNEARARFIATELHALNQATGQRKVLLKAAREFADQIVARKKIRDVRPAQYEAAEARAARNAEKAYRKGKGGLLEAATEKRNQLVNHYATRAAYDALDAVEKGLRYLGKFNAEGSRKNLDIDYLDQIDGLLDRFDLRKGQSLKAIDERKSLADWITEQEEQGLSPVIPDQLRNEAFRRHYRDLPVEEFRGLVDAVKNIEHLGRLKKRLLTAKDQRDFEAAVGELTTSIRDHAKGTVAERRMSDRGILVEAGKLFRGFVAEHRKFASLAEQLDGFQDGGKAWDYLVRNMNDAGNFEAVENEKATVALGKLFAPILKNKLGKKTFFPQIGKSFTYEEQLGIALNMGNEVNRERVLSGEGLAPAQLEQVLAGLTESDWAFVQGVWDYLESFRPLIAEKERRLTGVEPEWVEAAPVQTKFGQLRGGYYPIKYDVLRSSKAEADTAAEVQRQIERGLYTRAQTRRGHLKARVESTGRPIRYDLGTVFEHTSQVIHDLAWHEYLVDANRLLGNKAVDAAIRETQGPERLRAMKDTLRDVAVGQVGPRTAFGRIANHVRFGATITGLGWRLSTALLQPLGLTQSMSRIGVKWVAKGMKHWLGDTARLENSARLVGEKSDFMRLRAKTLQREINEIRNKVSGKDSRIQASYFYLIQKMQLVADLPTWWGAYEKAMSGADMTEAKAIALADQAVIDAQGSGQIKDLSGIERGQEGQKLFTVFYSFFNTTFNLTARAVGRTDFKSPASVALLAADMALLYAIPATLGLLLRGALRGDWDDPEEGWERFLAELPSEMLGYVLGTMVGVRELSAGVRAMTGQYSSYSGPASVRLFAEFQRLGQQAEQGEADAAFWKALNNVGGVFFHYPAGQLNQTAAGAAALWNGETENPMVLLTGPAR